MSAVCVGRFHAAAGAGWPKGGSRAGRARDARCAAAAAASWQPEGEWDPTAFGATSKNEALGKARAVLFYGFTLALAVPLFCAMLAMWPVVMLVDKTRRLAQHFVNDIWAIASMAPFYRVRSYGLENLPPADEACVYVANHQSFLDIFSLFSLRRPFKFVSKTSIFMIPIVGWSMFLTGHIGLKRTDRRSQMKVLTDCIDCLKNGASVLFFPEGTRSVSGDMAEFKKGGFSAAVKAGVRVVPITLLGTGQLMQSGGESRIQPGSVGIVVHPPMDSLNADGSARDADAMMKEARAVIASALPPGTY